MKILPNLKFTRGEAWHLALLLAAAAMLNIINLSVNGYANTFYAAAIQAGADNWTAFIFGASDMAGSVTVDKTPLSLWPAMLLVKLLGLSSWTVLLPQAVIGVITVALLYATVRRVFGVVAASIAGWVLAVTPVAVLMFRYNNPDVMLLLMVVAAVWATVRGLETSSWRWPISIGVFLGLGFLAKQLQVGLVIPAIAVVWFACAPTKWGRRLAELVVMAASFLVAAGWYVALCALWPADSRPYIGGSQNNSILELTLGYNGLGRLNGNETGSVVAGGGQGTAGSWGDTGLLRMFDSSQGGQISWLLPAALIFAVICLVSCWQHKHQRAVILLFDLWLLGTMVTFSFMQGIFHSYYTIALAPAIAALCGCGVVVLSKQGWAGRLVLLAVVLLSAAWGIVLLRRTSSFVPHLWWLVLVAAVALVVVWLGSEFAPQLLPARVWQVVIALVAACALFAGPMAYNVKTIASAHSGSLPTAGPSTGGRGGGGNPGAGGRTGAGAMRDGSTGPEGNSAAGGSITRSSAAEPALVAALQQNGQNYKWVAAVVGANAAATYQLASGFSVMPLGGYNGTDPTPTLEAFKELVAAGQIHFFLTGGSGRGANRGTAAQITTWVTSTFTPTTIGGVTVYDLSAGS